MSENHDPVVAEGPTPESAECPVLPGLALVAVAAFLAARLT